MSDPRKGEKQGWTLGWTGGFIWVLILAIVKFVTGEFLHAFMGIALVSVALIVIFTLAPWRHPTQPYWKLMLPIYFVLSISIAWLIWISEGIAQLGLNGWSLFLLLPLFIPFSVVGKRRWIDGERQNTEISE